MAGTRKLDILGEIGKLSPVEAVFTELERDKIIENLIGFIPCGDGTDTTHHLVNLAYHLSTLDKNVCILDANVFYPSLYKILDNAVMKAGKGILQLLKNDRLDVREEIQSTAMKNLYLVSASPFDPMEEYFDLMENDIERMLANLREVFDLVLVYIPNIPPLEFCYVIVKMLSIGFVCWSQRPECSINTERLFLFLNSIGISTAKLANVLYCNTRNIGFDISVIQEMRLRLIGEFPEIPAIVDLSLEGKIYMKDSVIMDKRYKSTITQIANIIGR